MEVFTSKYGFGDTVYLVTDPHQEKYIVCEIGFKPGATVYYITCGRESHTAYEFELSEEPNNDMKLGV